jgi:hypothetical protein
MGHSLLLRTLLRCRRRRSASSGEGEEEGAALAPPTPRCCCGLLPADGRWVDPAFAANLFNILLMAG